MSSYTEENAFDVYIRVCNENHYPKFFDGTKNPRNQRYPYSHFRFQGNQQKNPRNEAKSCNFICNCVKEK
ncbi:hypothetical protein KKD49_11760 [Myxococcota bacterium]|nr:hypothetical protein [Myxococcota bacterium]